MRKRKQNYDQLSVFFRKLNKMGNQLKYPIFSYTLDQIAYPLWLGLKYEVFKRFYENS